MGRNGLFTFTTAASINIATKACTFLGANIYASAACTITIKNSGGATLFAGSTDAAGIIMIQPALPIRMANGITVTDSGGGNYVVFYGDV